MSFSDILRLALRNLREAKLRAALTTMGVIVGVAMIVTMVSFGLGLQRNAITRFRELDLFNEITVYGRSLSRLAASAYGPQAPTPPDQGGARERGRFSERALNDAALTEMEKIPGVAFVEPSVYFSAYVRSNDRVSQQRVGGARVPSVATRFKEFAAGRMITAAAAPDATTEVVVDTGFVRDFGYEKPVDAIGQTVDLLAPPRRTGEEKSDGEPLSFFGLPLEEEENDDKATGRVAAKSFRIVGVLQDELEGGQQLGGRRFRGLLPAAGIYISLDQAQDWTTKNRDALSEVALQLARASGTLGQGENEGYASAVVRVTDPGLLTDVRKRLTELGFNSFSIVDQLDELRTFFLVINSALSLLGGISLLVASFGIANTMIMSIFERTREIGIMKAIGAEDQEIRLIFFAEATIIGLAGGILGALAAWAIDMAANHLAYRFFLQPRGASFVNFFAIPPVLWAGAILFAACLSIIAALYPAARASCIDPVQALRHD